MTEMSFPKSRPLNLSRRGFLSGTAGLVLATALPLRPARGQEAAPEAGPPVPLFLQIRPDGTAVLQSPFIEGGQGIYTALTQIVGEELDLDPAVFEVVPAPPGAPFDVMGGFRFTGGSSSVRTSYDLMRRLGATGRAMLVEAAAEQLGVPVSELSTRPGVVVHEASSREIGYGDLSGAAMELAVPAEVSLRDPSEFRWIRAGLKRLDIRDKSTGQAKYAIDVEVEGMLSAAVQHAPRLGLGPASVTNLAEIEAMRGVHSVHLLDGAVAVVADRFWQARRAVEAAEVEWQETEAEWPLPADFSSAGYREQLLALEGPGLQVEAEGDAEAALAGAETVIEAVYGAPFLAHGQLEPPSATARFNADGTLDLWLPNQAPEMFLGAAAETAGIAPDKVTIHSQMLGGFFGRHFLYRTANPFPQAIRLAKATGRPVKLVWTREEEFLRDAVRPMGTARFRGAVLADGTLALSAEVLGEGPTGRWYKAPAGEDSSAHEGISGKPYAIPNRRIGHVYAANPAVIGYWRAVGHSMHDYFYESFLDELAEAAGRDPYELRKELVAGSPRHATLLAEVETLSGGWQRGPYQAEDGTTLARGVAMASPFGSEVATMAEVSVEGGSIRVHRIWVAIDPGSIVNPAIIEAQVQSAVALGLSQTLVEEHVYEDGAPVARNFDSYDILRPDQMPEVKVAIVESGAKMGGIGEPGLPGVGPAVVNAAAALTGRRFRTLPLSGHDLSAG
ncbi:xanthine dehydrogenase family protein molybdopterin-binding subunit [Mangrovicoccus sp. HB161399]|uniref:xanthine dehydrogenase family protein molybdopterin-binding subunit n=1 Tax=Mangrovicoccus sp. HB161399 TaxID=2720392 RepID=UPI00155408F1|nr:xanthine dehydrogenase family protein molybdopterin-binding subunit [Mangrovicoccus sp. HB161399]